MHLKEMPQEYYFPVADSCNKSGDPSGGCLYSESIYHSFNYTVSSEVFNFTISDKNHKTILSDLVPLEDITRHSQRNLGCWDLSSCTKACDALSGVWNAYKNECIITRYLNKICYRVTYQDGKFVLDTSSYSLIKLLTSRLIDPEVGCYYSNLWSPYLYADSDHKHVIINVFQYCLHYMQLRYYLDPVISASEETRGCSDDKLYWKEDGNCFGATVKDQLRLGKQVLLIGLVLLLIEVIVGLIENVDVQLIVGLLVYYVYHNRRVNPKIQMSASMEMMFTPYSVDELTIMHSPHVEEIQEWTASQKSLLSS